MRVHITLVTSVGLPLDNVTRVNQLPEAFASYIQLAWCVCM
jgi:hypothetical protein